MIDAHARSGADVTLAVVRNPRPSHYNGIVAEDAGVVTGFEPKGPRANGTWHLVGVQIASARVFAGLPENEPAETVAGIYRTMVADAPGRIRVFPVTTSFVDVGTPRDYLRAALERPSRERRGNVHPSAIVHHACVWPQARVDQHVELDDVIVAGPVTIPAGTHLRSTMVLPASARREGDNGTVVGNLALFPLGAES
jgi:NDP-sugar pyrophosphorylase family protein